MKRKMKVLQSVNSFGIGGNTIFVINFFRHIDKEKFQVDFVIYDDTKMDFYQEVIDAGSKVFVCKSKYKNKYMRLYDEMRQVGHLLRHHHYDIIHCHSCSFVGIFRGAVPGHFMKGTKVITHAHNPGNPKNTKIDIKIRGMLKKICSYISDLGFACSEECGESKYTQEFRKGSRYSVINNAIEIEKYVFEGKKRMEERCQWGIEKEFVIGSVGRLEKQKNYLFLIDVLAELIQKKKNKQCRLLLVGEGSQRKQIEEKAERLGVKNYLLMVGKTQHPEEYYSAMDVFVLPSLYEGFGLVNIEAQASGLPCIVSTAVPRVIDISGRVTFLSLDVHGWCEALDKMSSNEKPDREKAYSEKYDIHKEVKRLESFYEDISG